MYVILIKEYVHFFWATHGTNSSAFLTHLLWSITDDSSVNVGSLKNHQKMAKIWQKMKKNYDQKLTDESSIKP